MLKFDQRFWWCAPDSRAPKFKLTAQDEACKSKTFRRRKVTLPNGIVLNTSWYTNPKAPPRVSNSSGARDVTLPNGIVLRATLYRNPSW